MGDKKCFVKFCEKNNGLDLLTNIFTDKKD